MRIWFTNKNEIKTFFEYFPAKWFECRAAGTFPASPRRRFAQDLRYRRPADRRSRPQRWRDALAELMTLKDEYALWLDTMPEQLRDNATE